MKHAPASTSLAVDYFDGLSAKARQVRMWTEGDMLMLSGPDMFRQVPLSKVRWPERTRHGTRQAHFADGGSVQAQDVTRWDLWMGAHQPPASFVVRPQQSWRWAILAAVLLLMVAGLGYAWGLPAVARVIAPHVPFSVDQGIGRSALQAMDEPWFKPSGLDTATQELWRARFNAADLGTCSPRADQAAAASAEASARVSRRSISSRTLRI